MRALSIRSGSRGSKNSSTPLRPQIDQESDSDSGLLPTETTPASRNRPNNTAAPTTSQHSGPASRALAMDGRPSSSLQAEGRSMAAANGSARTTQTAANSGSDRATPNTISTIRIVITPAAPAM